MLIPHKTRYQSLLAIVLVPQPSVTHLSLILSISLPVSLGDLKPGLQLGPK